MALTCENSEYTPEQKAEYRRNCRQYAYDKAQTARNLIADAYHKAYPHALRRWPRDGICHCQNPIEHGEIQLTLDEAGHEYHNHQNCHSWACPICAPKRAYARSREIERALIAAHKAGYKQFFATFTVPHRKSHTSRHVIKLLNDAYRNFVRSHAIRRLKSEYGYVGAIKCLDYTITDNGTHAHLHTIWIFDYASSDDFIADLWELQEVLTREFLKVWDRQVFNLTGEHIHKHYGFNLEAMEQLGDPDNPDAEAIARYAAKSISIYCSDKDKSKEGSITPFDLLRSDATEEQKAQYVDFYKGQKSRRHIMFSPKLKELLGIADVEDDPRPPAAVVAHLKYEHAYFLKDEAARQQFEDRAAISVAAALDWLESETRRQQSELSRRFYDPRRPHLPQNLEAVRERYVIKDLDGAGDDFPGYVRYHAARQHLFNDFASIGRAAPWSVLLADDDDDAPIDYDAAPSPRAVPSIPDDFTMKYRDWEGDEKHIARSYLPPSNEYYESVLTRRRASRHQTRKPSGLGIAMAKAERLAPPAFASNMDGRHAHAPLKPLTAPAPEPVPGTFGEDLFAPFASAPAPRPVSRVPVFDVPEPDPIPCPFPVSASPSDPAISPADVPDDAHADFWF